MYGHSKLVSKSSKTLLGAAGMAFWSGVVSSLYHHRRDFWLCGFFVLQKPNNFCCAFAVHSQPPFQFRFFADPVPFAEQSARRGGHSACPGDAHLGDARHLAPRPLDRAREHPISSVGSFRNSAAAHDHIFELEIGDWRKQ